MDRQSQGKRDSSNRGKPLEKGSRFTHSTERDGDGGWGSVEVLLPDVSNKNKNTSRKYTNEQV